MDKSFTMLCGLPSCGKSTYAAEQFNSETHTVITSDRFIEQIAREKQISYAEAFDKFQWDATSHCIAAAKEAFAQGKNVVWDQTNITYEERAKKLALVPDDYFKCAVVFELDQAEYVDRFVARHHQTKRSVSQDTVQEMSVAYERPGRFEGFDYVEVITE